MTLEEAEWEGLPCYLSALKDGCSDGKCWDLAESMGEHGSNPLEVAIYFHFCAFWDNRVAALQRGDGSMAPLSAPCYLKCFSSLECLILPSQLLVYNGVSYHKLSLFWQPSREQMQKCMKGEVFHVPVEFSFHWRSAVAGNPFWAGHLPQKTFL